MAILIFIIGFFWKISPNFITDEIFDFFKGLISALLWMQLTRPSVFNAS